MSHPSIATTVESYSPNNARLDLSAPNDVQHILNAINPLNYVVTLTDTFTFDFGDHFAYALDSSIGSALFFALQRLLWMLIRASRPDNPNFANTDTTNIHPSLFYQLGLTPPEILSLPVLKGECSNFIIFYFI